MITENLSDFIDKVLFQLKKLNINVEGLELDHFGYQTSSKEDYIQKKMEVQKIGTLVSENTVNGRNVSIFKFNNPYIYRGFTIYGFELIEPKQGQMCDSELEHLEFVLRASFQHFIDKYPLVTWDKTAMDRPEFAKLSLKFENNIGVKFHLKNIFEEIPVKA